MFLEPGADLRTIQITFVTMNDTILNFFPVSPVPPRLFNVIYYHSDKEYPSLGGIRLNKEELKISKAHLPTFNIRFQSIVDR